MSQQINLYNPVFRKQKKYFSATAIAQALGLVAVGMIAFSGYMSYQVRSLVALGAESQRQLDAQQSQLAALAKTRGAQGLSAGLAEELARTEAQVKLRRDLLASLRTGALGNVEGFSRYLAAFARQRTEGVWLTGLLVGGDENDLVVRGRVLRPELVPSYLKALNHEDVMRGRSVTDLTLNAIQETRPAVAAGQPGAAPPAAQETRRPLRFVEFNIRAPRRPEEAAKPEAGDARRGAAS
jgi:hypothetical protein